MKAFTLIETLVAVTILTLAVSGPLWATNAALVSAYTARDKLVASYLAQEGIEYAHAMRDDEYLYYAFNLNDPTASTDAWQDFVSPSGANASSIGRCKASTCLLDVTKPMGTGSSKALQTCSGSSCVPLCLHNGIYQQLNSCSAQGDTHVFTRTLQVSDLSPTEAQVVSTVTWLTRGTQYSVSSTVHLTPWQ